MDISESPITTILNDYNMTHSEPEEKKNRNNEDSEEGDREKEDFKDGGKRYFR